MRPTRAAVHPNSAHQQRLLFCEQEKKKKKYKKIQTKKKKQKTFSSLSPFPRCLRQQSEQSEDPPRKKRNFF
jgi:hypothetical protein